MGDFATTDSNKVSDYKDIDSRCIVKFRPGDDWEGQYGFDWFREGDYGEKGRTNSRLQSHYKDDNSPTGLVGRYGSEIYYHTRDLNRQYSFKSHIYIANTILNVYGTYWLLKQRNNGSWYAESKKSSSGEIEIKDVIKNENEVFFGGSSFPLGWEFNDFGIGAPITIDPDYEDFLKKASLITSSVDFKNDQTNDCGKIINADLYADENYSPITIKAPINVVEKMTELFGAKSNRQNKYYVPSISLFYEDDEKSESEWGLWKATIKLIIHAENILVLDFFVDEGVKGVKLNPRSIVIDGDYDNDDKTLTITLTNDFKYNVGDVSIGVLATHKSRLLSSKLEKTFAGKINIVNYKPKYVNVVFVPIFSRLNKKVSILPQNTLSTTMFPMSSFYESINQDVGCVLEDMEKIIDLEDEKQYLKRFLSQAQILPNIIEKKIENEESLKKIELLIDAASVGNPKTVATKTKKDIFYDDGTRIMKGTKLHGELEKIFNDDFSDLSNFYKVFFIFEDGSGSMGQSAGNPNDPKRKDKPLKNMIVFNHKGYPLTVSHELLHSLGLFHSFSNRSQFTFNRKGTSNIMDYPGKFKQDSLWRWQWDEVRDYIKKESESENQIV